MNPYPQELEERIQLCSGESLLLRPIKPEDEAAHQEFFTHIDSDDVYFRFFGLVKGFSHAQIVRYTQIDYETEMAFIAVGQEGDLSGRTVGVVRAVNDPETKEAEFAIVLRSDFKGKGLGYALLKKIIRYCRERGLSGLTGQVLASNRPMLELARDLGFTHVGTPESGVVKLRLSLDGPQGKDLSGA